MESHNSTFWSFIFNKEVEDKDKKTVKTSKKIKNSKT